MRLHLTFCSQLWRPRLIKDILTIENVQRRATKFILHDNSMDYKSRLITLEILPLMYWFELQDILFLVKCFKTASDNFAIFDFISFAQFNTRSSTSNKLKYKYCRTSVARPALLF